MKKSFKVAVITIIALAFITAGVAGSLAGCTEADRVNHDISKQSGYFNCERRVTVYNARTDKVILYIEGLHRYLKQRKQRACSNSKNLKRHLQKELCLSQRLHIICS